jgi:hypothetical protein
VVSHSSIFALSSAAASLGFVGKGFAFGSSDKVQFAFATEANDNRSGLRDVVAVSKYYDCKFCIV